MSRMIRLNIAPATETHCGDGVHTCPLITLDVDYCQAFGSLGYDTAAKEYRRLPACIAAEVGAEGRKA